MNNGKYVIVQLDNIEVAILFDNLIPHSDFKINYGNIVSAGFFDVCSEEDGIVVWVWGKSISLNLSSRAHDSIIIKRALIRREL